MVLHGGDKHGDSQEIENDHSDDVELPFPTYALDAFPGAAGRRGEEKPAKIELTISTRSEPLSGTPGRSRSLHNFRNSEAWARG